MTEALTTFIGDNQALLDEVGTYENSATTNADRVQGLERDLHKAVGKRDSLKDLIRTSTGLAEITEESLKGILTNGDEALRSEVATLQDRLAGVTLERDGLESKHLSEINTMRMTDMLRSMGVDNDVWNPNAFSAVADMMLEGAVYDNGSFTYKADDGATIFGEGGQSLTVQERLDRLKSDESVYQFKPVRGAGGGKGDKPGNTPKGKMSYQDKGEYYMKHGKLPDNAYN